MKTELRDKVVLVTGASSGIGRATAMAYAQEGARVAITYHGNREGAELTADRVKEAGGTPLVVRYDLADVRSIRDAVGEVGREWGGIDVLVANAVVWSEAIPRPGRPVPRFEDVPPEQWQEVLHTSLEAAFHTLQSALPVMRGREWGRVVLIGAGLADTGKPGAGAYGAGKSGLFGLMRSLAWELGPEGILVNMVVPGQTATETVRANVPPGFLEEKGRSLPSGRMSQPEDVARAVVFLGSAANGNINGETLRVTGGA
ncbi:NAD(P)-dependent dehydrogenase (short-subunit alcohol dehydrogenase family) [Kitasatospora sp. MAP12-15]|uniref:SDR family NAD(P)-dependent oxidoreductase n=1 Tax=unclassified Kitasatospora TaxID=2633591 RepID=UPI002474883A|nr:SDR family oxidoreductase [Kitasatospora sp. MAP12-44]MDH6113758.1 NAD(P)-dependent dehydrogenase (short-subunit alcohol dehydrogenase family) [Kitasatospora sp. MAP12-44]